LTRIVAYASTTFGAHAFEAAWQTPRSPHYMIAFGRVKRMWEVLGHRKYSLFRVSVRVRFAALNLVLQYAKR
jgi:hypothetical protein